MTTTGKQVRSLHGPATVIRMFFVAACVGRSHWAIAWEGAKIDAVSQETRVITWTCPEEWATGPLADAADLRLGLGDIDET